MSAKKLDCLDESNFLLYVAKHYDNPQCYDTNELFEDLKRIKYIKKLLTRYATTGELQERLILNHLTVLNNVFGPECLVKVLFLKMEAYMIYLKPFLILMNIMPDKVYGIGKDCKNFETDLIPLEQNIVNRLRQI